MHNDIQDVLGQSYGVPDDIDESDLMGELDALEADMAEEEHAASSGVPSYLQVHFTFQGRVPKLLWWRVDDFRGLPGYRNHLLSVMCIK